MMGFLHSRAGLCPSVRRHLITKPTFSRDFAFPEKKPLGTLSINGFALQNPVVTFRLEFERELLLVCVAGMETGPRHESLQLCGLIHILNGIEIIYAMVIQVFAWGFWDAGAVQ